MALDNNSTSKLLYQYPSAQTDREKKRQEFKKILPTLKKFYKGDDIKLFEQFSAIVYDTFTEPFFHDRKPEEHYSQLRYFFDLFNSNLETKAVGGKRLTLFKVLVEQPPESILPSNGKQVASTGIMIHTKEAPFIMETLGGYLNIKGHHVISGIYPVMTVKRKNGKVEDITPSISKGDKEVFIYFGIHKVINKNSIKTLQKEIESLLKSLFLTVADFNSMVEENKNIQTRLLLEKESSEDAKETADFLNWLVPSNFILMGIASHDIVYKGTKITIAETAKSKLGVFRDKRLFNIVYPKLAEEIDKSIEPSLTRPHRLIFDFLNASPSIIYHNEALDVIFIRECNKEGKPIKCNVILGRLSRGALTSKSSELPLLRKKLKRLFEMENIRPKSHMQRELSSAFNLLSKKELFYIDRITLISVLNISVSLKSEDELHLLVRLSPEFNYFTVILIFSSKNINRANLNKIRAYLEEKVEKKATYQQTSGNQVIAQAFFYFPLSKNETPKLDAEKTSKELRELIMDWDGLLMQNLVSEFGDKEGFALYNSYSKRLSDLYKEAVDPSRAVKDFVLLKKVEETGTIQLDINCDSPTTATLRLYWNHQLNLMKLIPTFANLGINVREEQPLKLKKSKSSELYIQLLMIEDTEKKIKQFESSAKTIIETIQLAIEGEIEDCPLNSLTISAGLHWKQVDVIRAYKNYICQVSVMANPHSVTETFVKYPEIMVTVIEYFELRFNPKNKNIDDLKEIKEKFFKQLEQVSDLNEDNTLKLLFNVVENSVRTNYYLEKDSHYLSFKINSKGVMQMPHPVPMAEIYVHSPHLEGIHLRGSMVARGGLRWSDRADDFRTEILGLMKTQMVKNSVIVPAGSKGGFVLKKFRFKNREEKERLFKEHYQVFIKGLLDITDNIVDGETVHPKDVVMFDGPDPYLVVAADKGTATMSDAANEVSKNKGFWLKDAFASGGSVGYDHKKFGITAKGAWECIKRHFREKGIDIQNEQFTVAGVGGMAGDVFGNGMLLSKQIKLVAAFDHLNIFIDPNPDTKKSWKERERLFNKPRCTWADYRKTLLSKGGGIYNRASKLISLSQEAQQILGLATNALSGQELIKAILKMEVDLLYFGGIGTYIRASHQTNADVGDKANDQVRVKANELRAKVIGEGANLATTQPSRIEFAENGGMINTDSVDNSAGVDISDHEVNLKILLEELLHSKELSSEKERNELFAKLGSEIAEMVLKDNYYQSAGISMDQKRSQRRISFCCDYVDALEAGGLIDREEENIPEREVLEGYAKKPGFMLRPIFSVLFGYEKIRLNEAILASPIVDTAFAKRYFYNYFPKLILHDYEKTLNEHRLKKEIISMVISNMIVNQAGVTLISSLEKSTGEEAWEVCRAYIIASHLLKAEEYREMVHALDNKIDAGLQLDLLLKMEDLIRKVTDWMLSHFEKDRVSFDLVNQYEEAVTRFKENLFGKVESICSLEDGCISHIVQDYEKRGVPTELAQWLSVLPYMKDIMPILSIKEERHGEFLETGNLYILVSSTFNIDWILRSIEKTQINNEWENKMADNIARELELTQRNLVLEVLNFKRKGESMDAAFANFMREHSVMAKSYNETIHKIKSQNAENFTSLSVLVDSLKEFL